MRLLDLPEIDEGLRDYQKLGKHNIYQAWESCNTVLYQMPTGTGKTRLFSSLIKDTQRLAQSECTRTGVLVLAHRTELIDQIDETLSLKYGIAHGIIKSGYEEEMQYPVQVASVQTIVRRLDRWGKRGFSYIIIDEAHHAVSPTYLKICKAFPEAKILGVTATPCRLTGDGLKKLFKSLVLSQPVTKFIEQGYLSPYHYYSIKPESQIQQQLDNISNFNIEGDYAEADMMRICNTNKVRANIVKAYLKYVKGKKGIIYTINQEHNKRICEEFAKIGVKIKAIDSKTPADERKKTVSDFKHGKIDIICNVNIFSEGFDCPDCEFIQLARPTCSLSMYLQQVGRGLRPHERKSHAVILDNVGSFNKFGLPSANRKWRAHFEGSGQRVTKSENSGAGISRSKRNLKEGDEEMLLIFDGGTATSAQTEQRQEEVPVKNDILEAICATKEWFPFAALTITDVFKTTYLYVDEFDEDEWHSNIEDNLEMLCKDTLLKEKIYRTYKFIYEGKYGVCELHEADSQNPYTIILPPIFDEIGIPDSWDRYICKRDGLYGVISSTQKQILPFEFQAIEPQSDGMFIVKKNGHLGVLDGKKIVIPISNEEITHIFISMGESYYAILEDDRYTLQFYRSRKLVSTEHSVKVLHNFVDNVYVGTSAKGHAFICNSEGGVLFPINFTKLGLLTVKDKWEAFFSGGGSRAYLFDKDFELIRQFEDVPSKAKEVIEKYHLDKLYVTSGKNIQCYYPKEVTTIEQSSPKAEPEESPKEKESRIFQAEDGKYGYRVKGKLIVEPIYDKISEHWNDRIIVTKDGLKGAYAISSNNAQLVIPTIFKSLKATEKKYRYDIGLDVPMKETALSQVKEQVGEYLVIHSGKTEDCIKYREMVLVRYKEIRHIGQGVYIVQNKESKYGLLKCDGVHPIIIRAVKYSKIEIGPDGDSIMLYSENRRPRYVALHTLIQSQL